ncbi:hypothetical protein [Pseudomonas aeruginosa]|uniref:hypothetical protein n=1 Tax=Pseudomonas aeruginosa TaxID=287 RepID=UPI0013A5888C|nr:hypothetical protein [Pseudomonas aeruginosa]
MRTEFRVALSIGIVLLGACANKEPVQKFATSTEELVKSFDSFASRAKATCQSKYMYMDLDASGNFDANPEGAKYKAECSDYDQAYTALKVYSNVVSAYASSLGKLAGVENSVFADDIDGVSTQISKWKTTGGDKVNADTVSAATKLIKSAAEAATGIMVDNKIKKELRENHENLVIVVDDMKKFANEIQQRNLESAKRYASVPLEQLIKLSYVPSNENKDDQFTNILASGTESKRTTDALGARLPYRILQAELYKNISLIDQEKVALKSFGDSCDALIKAHRDLRDNYGELNKEEMLKKIKEFYDKVKEARENFIALRS